MLSKKVKDEDRNFLSTAVLFTSDGYKPAKWDFKLLLAFMGVITKLEFNILTINENYYYHYFISKFHLFSKK